MENKKESWQLTSEEAAEQIKRLLVVIEKLVKDKAEDMVGPFAQDEVEEYWQQFKIENKI